MSDLTQIVSDAFASEYRMRGAEIHKWVDPLSEELFWRNPYSYGNSVGHLLLHLTGNLSYYIGARREYGLRPESRPRIRRIPPPF